jgi:hypothetical protein
MNTFKIQDYPYSKEINGTFESSKAQLSIFIHTGTWEEYGSNYNNYAQGTIGVDISKNSGEDGFAAPNLMFPVLENFEKFSSIHNLVGVHCVETWKDPFKDDYRFYWEGVLGNDLDGCLTGNDISFKKYSSEGFIVDWSANITTWVSEGKWGEKIGSIYYDGTVTFNGVSLRVKMEGDEDAIIQKVFSVSIDEWNKNWNKQQKSITFNMPKMTEIWQQITYTPKA